MAGRLYVCPVVGTGSDEDPQRPLIADLGARAWSACIATGQDGKRSLPWAIVWADAADWSQVDGTAHCFHLTADVLDDPPPARVKNYLVTQGITTRAQANAIPTLRDVADALVKRHYGHSSLAEAFPQIGA